MAYQKAIAVHCETAGCMKLARVEVFNARNASLGRYCRVCGLRKLTLARKAEAEGPSQAARA